MRLNEDKLMKKNTLRTGYTGLRVFLTFLGAMFGGCLQALAMNMTRVAETRSAANLAGCYVLSALIFAIISWILIPWLIRGITAWANAIEASLRDKPARQIVSALGGLISGLVVATLASQIFRFVLPSALWLAGAALMYLMLGILGVMLGARRGKEVFKEETEEPKETEEKTKAAAETAKNTSFPGAILDSSVLIDGRIYDVCRTGFVQVALIIPQFVLQELQHIADMADSTRRARGRRGLDTAEKMQKDLDVDIQLTDADFQDTTEVDVKLLKLAKQTGAAIMTTDFNLQKVANLSGVQVLNLNALAGALRLAVLPGDEMQIQILKEGKEPGQGVGYLKDGTMVVVDGARNRIGDLLEIVVTSALQTSAGKMIFARIKEEE